MFRKKKVLFIDDNLDTLKLMQETLPSNSFECITASSAAEGLEKVKAFQPQLILLDLMLPKMSGLGFLRELKNDKELRQIPVVIFTALGDEEIATEMMELGAVGYLRKTCEANEIISMVEEYAV